MAATVSSSPITQTRAPARFAGWVEPVAVTGFFLLLTLVMTWPWAAHMGEAINPFGDVVVQMTSLRWNAHALITNPAGLFEAPFFYPYAHSLAFSENLIGQTLLALPFLLLTGNPAFAANFNILLSFVLTGVFTYLLVRDLTGSRAAGLLSGVAFAFCPFRFMQMGHLHMLATQWFPLTLWALLGIRDQVSGARAGQRPLGSTSLPYILFALGFIAMGLSSVYYTYFLALAVLLYIAWWVGGDYALRIAYYALRRGGRAEGSTSQARQAGNTQYAIHNTQLLRLGLAVLAIALVLGPVFLPYWQSNHDLGFSRSTYEVQNWAAEWSFYGHVLQSNWLYAHVLAPAMASAGGERELFPGIVATLLGVAGIVWGVGRSRFYYVLLGLLSLVLTFGLSGQIPGTSIDLPLPYAFLYDWVPGFKALRVPVRFAVLLDLSIYVLAGYGVAALVRFAQLRITNYKLRSRQFVIRNFVIRNFPVLLTGLVLLEFVNPLDTSNHRDVTAQLASTEPYGWLARPENAGPVLELPMTAGQDDVWYTFFGTRHWQPLVNGWSSFVPPGTVRLKQALDSFPDPFTVSLLQGLEVRHVLVHLWQFPGDVQADLKRRLDSTPQLQLVDRDGDNYVYRLAPDPWLRRIAARVGNGTLWIGEARHESMPTLEVLAYALMRWGVPADHIGGNIDLGYRPIGSLPFGTAPDYALVPAAPDVGVLPFGLGQMQPVEGSGNAAVGLLQRNPAQLKSYDLSAPGAPRLSPGDINLGIGASNIAFGGAAPAGESKGRRWASLSLLLFAPADVTVRTADQAEKQLRLPAGLTRYDTPAYDAPYNVEVLNAGDARLLRAELWEGENAGGGQEVSASGLMPLEVTPSWEGGTLDTRLRVVPPKGGGDFTATVDVYVEPWGTHPEGHFGSWSVVLPADGTGHDYAFHLDPVAKKVSTTRDWQPVETFAWIGPPTQGDFRATLSITRGDKTIANVPLSLFTLKSSRLTGQEPESASLEVVGP